MPSTWTAMELPLIATMGSRPSTSTRANQDNINQYLRAFPLSKTLSAAEPQTKNQTIITSKTRDRILICREWSNLMGIVYHIVSSSNRQIREPNHMARICCKNLIRARRVGPRKPRKFSPSQKMLTLSCRSRWGLNRLSSLRTSLNIRKIFWSSLIVMKFMQN